MNIDLNRLYKTIEIDNDYVFPKEMYEHTDILDLKNVHAIGKIGYNLSEEIEIVLDVTGTMILQDAITLKEIEYPFQIHIEEILEENSEEKQEYLKKEKNILDIIEFLWENIVLEVPISLTEQKNAHLQGDGWQLGGEEKVDEIDPRLQKLNDIFKGGEEKNGSSFQKNK